MAYLYCVCASVLNMNSKNSDCENRCICGLKRTVGHLTILDFRLAAAQCYSQVTINLVVTLILSTRW